MDLGGTAMMGGGGPMITGNWINLKTGETVTVRDSFMDGDDMVIMLTNGRQLTLSDFQDYVQQSEEEYDEHGNMMSNTNGGGIAAQPESKPHHKPANVDAATVFAGMEEEKVEVPLTSDLYIAMNNPPVDTGTKPVKEEQSSGKAGYDAAVKILKKVVAPKFNVDIDWPEFPMKELTVCKEYFDTTDDDIAKAIINMYCTGHELEAALVKWLQSSLKK